jgi:hypothetical protein
MKTLFQNKSFKIILSVLLVVIFQLFISGELYAQCAMCRISLENNLNNGTLVKGSGMNTGILYLLLMPYLIIGLIVFMWRKNIKKNEKRTHKIQKYSAS